MQSFDILVNTSLSEGFPNVVAEAMATGIPCAATDVGDTRLIVGDTGFVSPPGDMAAMAAAAEMLLAEPPEDKARRSTAARARIEERFGIHAVASRYSDLYRAACLAAR